MPIKSKGDGDGGTVDLSAIQQQIDSLDPSRPLGSFDPATISDGPLPAADRNDYLWASSAGTITLNGTDHEVTKGDWVRCDVDGTAANTPANWSFVDRIGTTRLSRFQCYRDTSKTFAGDGTTNTGAGSVSGSDGGVITIPAAGTYTVTHTGTNVTGGAGAGFGINSTPFANPQAANDVVTGDIFTSSLDRINSTTPSKSYSVAFPSAGDYHLAFFSGGSNTTGSHELVVAGIGSDSGETVSVFTSEDGTQYAFADSDNREIDISGGIPASWMKCSDQQAITQVFDGATIDAAPPWEGLVSIGDQATKVIPTGVDLSQVDEVRVTFGRNNNTWGKIVASFDPSEIDFGVSQGTLLTHFDTTYLSISNMTAAQFATGDIPFRAVTGQATFGFEISKIEFKKRAVGVSRRLGEMVHLKSTRFADDAAAMAEGYLPVKPGTIAGGATDYPLWAAIYPEFVSDADIVFPPDVDGMFLRSVGGNAGAEGNFQSDDLASHTHTHIDTNHHQFTNNGNGSNVARRGSQNTNRTTGATGGIETRPVNRAYQLYTILDSYVEVRPAPPAIEINDNAEHLTGRTVNGKPEWEAVFAYALVEHTSLQTISVPALSNFTGAIDQILDLRVVTFDASGNPYSSSEADDVEPTDFVIDRTDGSAGHTYEGNWVGFSARWTARYTKA